MRRFSLSIVLAMAILLMGGVFVQISAQPAAKKPFTFQDMMSLKRIGGPVVSPDGKWVLFAAVDVDLKENKRISHLWVVPDGRRPSAATAWNSRGRERRTLVTRWQELSLSQRG